MDILVRDAKLEDAERILDIYAYYVENTAITFEYVVPTLMDFKAYGNDYEKIPLSCY